MAHPNFKTFQLVSNQDNKKSINTTINLTKAECLECVVCVKKSSEIFNIFTTLTTNSGTPLYTFLSRFTNTEHPFHPNLVKYICSTCINLVNILERAEMDYRKLKDSFESIIKQNPLFCLPQQVQLEVVKAEPKDSDDDDNRHDDESAKAAPVVKDVDPIAEDASQLSVREGKNEAPYDGEHSSSFNAVVKMEPLSEDELEPASSLCETELKPVDCTKRTRGRARKSKPQKIQINEVEKQPEKPTGERPFECTVCQRRFMLKHHLKDHMKIHTGEKPHECHICAYRSSRKDDFIRHFRTHTGEKPYQCEVCQSSFKLKSHLREHERTHTGEKPYECNVCNRRFNYRHVLKSHCRTHTSEKPFECQICQRRFNQRSHLKSHVKIHTGEKPFECTVCQTRFNRRTSLQEHVRTHTGEKPFECEICHHRYNQKGNLMKHLRMHAVGKAFACHICQRRFYYNHVLVKHLKSHGEDRGLVVQYQQNSDSHSATVNDLSQPQEPKDEVENGLDVSK